jgi:hypothetical protein
MNEEVFAVIVRLGARVSVFVEDIFEGQWMKVYARFSDTSHELLIT